MGVIRKTAVVLVALPLLAGAGHAAAAQVTLHGTQLSYTFDDAELGLFGTASLSGNDLVFTPTSFMAASDGTQFAVQTIHLIVSAKAGFQLEGLSVNESGGSSLTGAGEAWVTGNLKALDIEGNPNPPAQYVAATLGSVFDGAGGWTAQANVALPASGWGGADGIIGSVGLTLTNQLFASAFGGGSASVYKDAVVLSGVTSPVPEPSTYAMLLAGIAAVGTMARRRARAA